jgi:hypothetical protein
MKGGDFGTQALCGCGPEASPNGRQEGREKLGRHRSRAENGGVAKEALGRWSKYEHDCCGRHERTRQNCPCQRMPPNSDIFVLGGFQNPFSRHPKPWIVHFKPFYSMMEKSQEFRDHVLKMSQ